MNVETKSTIESDLDYFSKADLHLNISNFLLKCISALIDTFRSIENSSASTYFERTKKLTLFKEMKFFLLEILL
jgi:hypothetical protein